MTNSKLNIKIDKSAFGFINKRYQSPLSPKPWAARVLGFTNGWTDTVQITQSGLRMSPVDPKPDLLKKRIKKLRKRLS